MEQGGNDEPRKIYYQILVIIQYCYRDVFLTIKIKLDLERYGLLQFCVLSGRGGYRDFNKRDRLIQKQKDI